MSAAKKLRPASPAALMDAQRAEIARAQAGLSLRQRRIVRAALAEVELRMRRAKAATWTQAEAQATRLMLGQGLKQMTLRLQADLGIGLGEVTKVSAQACAKTLATLDATYMGAVRPLRFDTLAWWERTSEQVNAIRLRMYAKSYARYGASTVTAIEDAIAKRVLIGDPWPKARDEVWKATRSVVGERQWMVDRIVRTEVAAVHNATTLAALYEENTRDEPMLKKLVATFDEVTGPDSLYVHGQTRHLGEAFVDNMGRSYQAPPNRPHDREVVVGWRASWGKKGSRNARHFDKATRAPARAVAVKRARVIRPPAPKPTDVVQAPRTVEQLKQGIAASRARKAMLGLSIAAMLRQKASLPPGSHPPQVVAQIAQQNAAVEAQAEAMRAELRDLLAALAALQLALRKREKDDEAVIRLPQPAAISTVPGPGK